LCVCTAQGKTVVTLALILANPPTAAPAAGAAGTAAAAGAAGAAGAAASGSASASVTPAGMVPSSATLVVCAVSLVGQWIAEAKDKLASGPSALKIHMYHGQGRSACPRNEYRACLRSAARL
jgi:hypothetical protein